LVLIASFIVCVVAPFSGVSFLVTFKISNFLALASRLSLGEIRSEVVVLEAEDKLASFLDVRLASRVAVLVGRS
jgi:hypothetical protein